jgi:hypothetical protein
MGLLGTICPAGRPTVAAAEVTAASVTVSVVAARVVVVVAMLRRKKLPDFQRNVLSYLNNRNAVPLLELGHNSERLTYITCIIMNSRNYALSKDSSFCLFLSVMVFTSSNFMLLHYSRVVLPSIRFRQLFLLRSKCWRLSLHSVVARCILYLRIYLYKYSVNRC